MKPPDKNRRVTPSYRPAQVEKSAPCQSACLNCGDIRGWIGLVAQRRKLGLSREESYARAWEKIAEVNPFPATLGRICPHPCESACNRGGKDEPLAINQMERFLGDFAIGAGLPLPRADPAPSGASVAVVGAGPSGLSFAYQMARRGHRVTVYDAREAAGGMLRFGVPVYRLPREVLQSEIARIIDLGVDVKLGVSVGSDIGLESLRAEHEFIYLGVGAQLGKGLNVPGADGPGVITATDYLAAVNRGRSVELGKRVCVVGGGNSAIDAARSARRGGSKVVILYRRTLDEMPASQSEIDEAVEEGVELMFQVVPTRIERDPHGRPVAVHVARTAPGKSDGSGRPRPVVQEGTEFPVPASALVVAIAQVPILDGFDGVNRDGDWLLTDEVGFVTADLLAGGDAVNPGMAGSAIVQGRHAAERLHDRISGSTVGAPGRPERAAGPEDVRHECKPSIGAIRPERHDASHRLAHPAEEVTHTIDEAAFLAEVERCFSCGSCFGCERCFMYCTAGCFTHVEEPRPGTYFSLDLDRCRECGKCVEVCPCGFLEVT